jgi:hypothetical protein
MVSPVAFPKLWDKSNGFLNLTLDVNNANYNECAYSYVI